MGKIGQKKLESCTNETRKCLLVLKDVAPAVMPLLMHESPEAKSHVDPRPTIAEAWFLAMSSLVSICRHNGDIAASLVRDDVEYFLGESLSIAIALIFLKSLGSKTGSSPVSQKGMSLDGPHTLAFLKFESDCMLLGPSILSAAGRSILSGIQVNDTFGRSDIGAAILSASLLRAVSGEMNIFFGLYLVSIWFIFCNMLF